MWEELMLAEAWLAAESACLSAALATGEALASVSALGTGRE
jgi:hypothetical protein